jgi:hypothetical protein
MSRLAKGKGGRAGVLIPDFGVGNGGALASSVETTFVVDPFAMPGKNVYTTLLAAAAARRLVTGPAIVTFRASMIHPAAAYDLRDAAGDWNTTFASNGGFRAEQFAAGSTLDGVTTFELPVNFLGPLGEVLITAPAPVGSAFSIFRLNIGIGGLAATGGGDFFDASNVVGQNSVWILKEAAGLFQAGGNILCARGANASLFIIPLDDTTIAQNTLVESAGGLITVTQAAPGALVNRTQVKLVTSGPNLNAVPGGNLNLTSSALNIKGPNGGNPITQAGPAKIDGVTGKSPFIPATITASSRITGFLRSPLGAALTTGYGALPGDRMLGVAGAGGGFQLSAFLAGGPGTNVADGSDLDWEVTN